MLSCCPSRDNFCAEQHEICHVPAISYLGRKRKKEERKKSITTKATTHAAKCQPPCSSDTFERNKPSRWYLYHPHILLQQHTPSYLSPLSFHLVFSAQLRFKRKERFHQGGGGGSRRRRGSTSRKPRMLLLLRSKQGRLAREVVNTRFARFVFAVPTPAYARTHTRTPMLAYVHVYAMLSF